MEKVCNYFGEQRFRVWCQKVLPTVYDDSLSYYELLCKVLRVLQEFGTELSTFEGFVNETLVTDVVDISERLDAVAEKVEKVFNAVGGEVAYLGHDVNMSDIPDDAGLVVGNGTSDEPYNSFEAGGSKAHGGWIKVGSKVVPQSDLERFTENGFMFGDTELTESKVKILNEVGKIYGAEINGFDDDHIQCDSLPIGTYKIAVQPYNIAYQTIIFEVTNALYLGQQPRSTVFYGSNKEPMYLIYADNGLTVWYADTGEQDHSVSATLANNTNITKIL